MKLSESAFQKKVDFEVSKSEKDKTSLDKKAPAAGPLKKWEHRFPDQFGFYPEEDGVVIRREE